MPPRRSDPKSRRADADAQMRKLEESLASLRSAAREYARRGRSNVLRVDAERWRAASAEESTGAVLQAARLRVVVERVVARLRAIARKLWGSR